MHTKDMLADALTAIGLTEMAAKASQGYYHDFLSPLDLPELQLCEDLMQEALRQSNPRRDEILTLRECVINGDFDANAEESEAWAQSEEGRNAFKQLIKNR